MSEPTKENFLWRLINLSLGAIYVILAFYVSINPGIAVGSMILVLAIVVLFSGVLRIINAFFEKDINGFYRIFYLALGILGVFIGLSIVVLQDLGLDILIILLSVSLALQGISRIGTGTRSKPLPNWLQVVFILSGVATIGLAIFVLISTDIAILTLTLFLAYGFLINGFTRLLMAFSGHNPHKIKK